MEKLESERRILEKEYEVKCILVGYCNYESVEYTIRAFNRRDVRIKLKEHIKRTYPKEIGYRWEFFTLRIRLKNKLKEKNCL